MADAEVQRTIRRVAAVVVFQLTAITFIIGATDMVNAPNWFVIFLLPGGCAVFYLIFSVMSEVTGGDL